MDLWIRSQNRQLIRKANYEMCYNERNGHNYIVIDGDVLGSYKTKERALQILDEIENILQPKVIWKEPKTDIKYDENFIQTLANDMVIQTTQQVEYDLKQAGQIVYKMPED